MIRTARLFSVLMGLWLVSLSGLALAQQPNQMMTAEMMKRLQDPAAMQRMAAEAQAAQKCLEDIDQKKLDALKKRAEAASNEIERLCKAGKKDQALAKALALGEEMRSDVTIKKLQECTKGMTQMIQNMPWAQMPGVTDESDPKESDICS